MAPSDVPWTAPMDGHVAAAAMSHDALVMLHMMLCGCADSKLSSAWMDCTQSIILLLAGSSIRLGWAPRIMLSNMCSCVYETAYTACFVFCEYMGRNRSKTHAQ